MAKLPILKRAKLISGGLKMAASGIFGFRLYEGGNNYSRKRRFRGAQSTDILKALDTSERRAMMDFGRMLYANLGPVKGACKEISNLAVGRAWIPQFRGKNKQWGDGAEAYLLNWMENCDVRGGNYNFRMNLRIQSVSMSRDGDRAIMLTKDADGNPKVQYFPAHRIGVRECEKVVKAGVYKGFRIYDGVITDDSMQPLAYRILGTTPEEDQDVSAASIMLHFEPEWDDQLRGITDFSHAILDLQDIEDIKDFEKTGVKAASSIGLIETNENGEDDVAADLDSPDSPAADPSVKDLEDGLYKYFKAGTGSKLEAFMSSRPSANVTDFMENLYRGCYQGIEWPYEFARNSGQVGGANSRMLIGKAMRTLEKRQEMLLPGALLQIRYAIACAIDRGELDPDPDWYMWKFQMPQKLTVDYGRESEHNREDIRQGLRTISEDAEERGVEFEELRNTIEAEADDILVRAKRLAGKHGITMEVALSLLQDRTSGGSQPSQNQQAKKEEKK